MNQRPIVIDHPSQLNALSTLPLLRSIQRGPVRLAGDLKNHPQREEWEKDINRLLRTCGCSSAANGLLLGIVVATMIIAYQMIADSDGTTLTIVVVTVATLAIGFAVAGKLTGLAAANRKLRALVSIIQSNWKVENLPGNAGLFCG
jgi:hypothetical protein